MEMREEKEEILSSIHKGRIWLCKNIGQKSREPDPEEKAEAPDLSINRDLSSHISFSRFPGRL